MKTFWAAAWAHSGGTNLYAFRTKEEAEDFKKDVVLVNGNVITFTMQEVPVP